MNVVSIDLEMNNPTYEQKIISVGVTVGSLYDRTILTSKDFFVNPREPLTEFIKKLCNISQETVDNAKELQDVYLDILSFIKPYSAHKTIIEWGTGDCYTLRRQLSATDRPYEWFGSRSSMNVKNLVQAHMYAVQRKAKGGLEKSLVQFGESFDGTPHSSEDDSRNTMAMFFRYLEVLDKTRLKSQQTLLTYYKFLDLVKEIDPKC